MYVYVCLSMWLDVCCPLPEHHHVVKTSSRRERRIITSPVDTPPQPSPRVVYERRKMTAEELNEAVRHAYRCVDQAYRDISKR